MRIWLKNARMEQGLTMKQISDKLHISESYYCLIENGSRKRNMDISLAEKISETLNIPLEEILRAESEIRNTKSESEV